MLPDETFSVLTPPLADAINAICGEEAPLTLLLGENGVGKSYGSFTAAMRSHRRPLLINARPRMTAAALAETIIGEATSNPLQALSGRGLRRDELPDLVADTLDGDDAIIVIDDAHHLAPYSLGWIDDLQRLASVQLVLVGTPAITDALPVELLLRARAVRFQPLDAGTVVSTVRRLHSIYLAAARETIHAIDRRYCHGNLARWSIFTGRAAAACSATRTATISNEIAGSVLDDLEALDAAA
jgi:hypothetical protein